jgi:hypothetical protein
MLAAEMMRVLGRAAMEHPLAMRAPERALALIRNDWQDYSVNFTNDDDWPRLRRHAERIAMAVFYSVAYGQLLDPIERPDGELTYEIRIGHCGDELCCGPAPMVRPACQSG